MNRENNSRWFLYPLIIVMAIIPLIVHQKVVPTNLEKYSWYSVSEVAMDFFLYYKSVWLVTMMIVMLVILCVQVVQKEEYRKVPKLMIPAGIYGLLILLSIPFSKDRNFSIHGILEQYESGIILFGYLVIMYYAYLFVDTEKKAEFLINAWGVSIAILCILGFLQVLGHDFFATDFGKKLLLSKEYWDSLDEMSFTFGVNRIYLTLYNPNYVGVYATIAIPILLAFVFFTKKILWKVIYGVLTLGMVICIVGSASKTAFLSLAVILVFAIVLARKNILKNWKIIVPGVVLIAIVFVVFDTSTGHIYTNAIKYSFQVLKQGQITVPNVSRVDTLDEEVVIDYLNNPLHISYTRSGDGFIIRATDDAGNEIHMTQEESKMVLQDERFAGTTITPILVS